MAKNKAEKNLGNKISKTTIILYVVVIIISIVFLSIMSAGQGGGGNGCCDCSTCDCICCDQCSCDYCTDQNDKERCGCISSDIQDLQVPPVPNPMNPGATMSAVDYFCMWGDLPPPPVEPLCYFGEEKECPLQMGVCQDAHVVCDHRLGYATDLDLAFPPCTVRDVYRPQAVGGVYEVIEMTCDGADNNCDGVVDEGCDDDGDEYCERGMKCSGGTFKCKGTRCTDCDDDDETINPGAEEECDDINNDCDDEIDEDGCLCDPVGAVKDCGKTSGVCGDVKKTCLDCNVEECENEDAKSEWSSCNFGEVLGNIYAQSESGPILCHDTLDNDCDGGADCADRGCFCKDVSLP